MPYYGISRRCRSYTLRDITILVMSVTNIINLISLKEGILMKNLFIENTDTINNLDINLLK